MREYYLLLKQLTFGLVNCLFILFFFVFTFRSNNYTWYFLPLITSLLSWWIFFSFLLYYFTIRNQPDKILRYLIKDSRKKKILKINILIFSIFLISTISLFLSFIFTNELFDFFSYLPLFPIKLAYLLFDFINVNIEFDINYVWVSIFSFIILLPLIFSAYSYYLKQKVWTFDKESEEFDLKKNQGYNNTKPEKNQINSKKKYLLLVFTIVIPLIYSLNSHLGRDTEFYYILVKDFFENGNINLLFNPTAMSFPYSNFSKVHTYQSIPIIFLLIVLTYITFGNISLAGTILNILLFLGTTFFIIEISNKIFMKKERGLQSGYFFIFSVASQLVLIGIYKQFFSLFLISLSFYFFILFTEKQNFIHLIISLFTILFSMLTYIFAFGFWVLVISQFFFKSQIFNVKKKNISIKIVFVMIELLIFFGVFISWFFLKDSFDILTLVSSYPLSILRINSFENFQNSIISIIYLGPQLILSIFAYRNVIKKKFLINKKTLYFLTSLFEVSLFYLISSIFGIGFLAERMIHFTILPVAILSGYGFDLFKKKVLLPFDSLKATNFSKLKKIKLNSPTYSILILIFSSTSLLSIPFYRETFWLKEEEDAFQWFIESPDYELLSNENMSDMLIVTNFHLIYPLAYNVHYNCESFNWDLERLISNLIRPNLIGIRNLAEIKLYLLISNYTEPSGENIDVNLLKNEITYYQTVFPFIWNNYTVNDMITIWELEYI